MRPLSNCPIIWLNCSTDFTSWLLTARMTSPRRMPARAAARDLELAALGYRELRQREAVDAGRSGRWLPGSAASLLLASGLVVLHLCHHDLHVARLLVAPDLHRYLGPRLGRRNDARKIL